ncbi:MAG: PDZ domain-containing protein [Candidatus Eisenbacteria bacterium]|nr:PDZ domain-containing protein [Candidatus Eisenbacteria bacterium]
MFRGIVAGAVLTALCMLLVAPAAVAVDITRTMKVYAPEDDAREFKVVIEGDEDQAWLGVSIQDLDADTREAKEIGSDVSGVFVASVYEGSPAEEAGIESGDVIIRLGSEETGSVDDLIDAIDDRKPGDDVEIEVLRDDMEQILIATLGSKPEEMIIAKGPFVAGLEGLKSLAVLGDMALPWFEIGISGAGRGRLGVYIDDMSEGLAEYFEVPDGKGVLVEDVVEDSPAEKAGIRAGDVIIEVGGMRVVDRASLVEAISEMEADAETPVVIVRKGEEMTLVAIVGESEYEKAIKEYEKAIEKHAKELSKARSEAMMIDDETKEELKEDLEELRDELEELKEELREMKKE